MAYHHNFDPVIWSPLIIHGFACILVTILATIYLGYTLHSKPQKIPQKIKILSVLALVCFFIALVSNCAYVILYKLPHYAMKSLNIQRLHGYAWEYGINLWNIWNLFYAIGYLFTYWLFWLRLVRYVTHTLMDRDLVSHKISFLMNKYYVHCVPKLAQYFFL